MFRQYTRSLNYLANQLLTLDNNLAVIRPTDDKKSYIVKGSLAPSDLCHTTEIYTMFGRAKLIVEDEKLLALIQPSKVPIKTIKEMRYHEPTLYLISNDINDPDNVSSIFKKLSQMKSIFFEKNLYKLNDEIKTFIDDTLYSIKRTKAFLVCSLSASSHKFELTPDTILAFEQLKKQISDIDTLMSAIPLTKYVIKK